MAVSNWWINSNGKNALKGVEGDPDNPILCQSDDILYFLQQYPDSYDAFFVILPTMLPEEQARLRKLIAENPYVNTPLVEEKTFYDEWMRAWAVRGIRVAGPRGGGL